MGAEESKPGHWKNEKGKKDYRYENVETTKAPVYYTSKNTASLERNLNGSRPPDSTMNRTHDKEYSRSRARKNRGYDEKENRHRRRRHHSSDDKLSDGRRRVDKSPARERIASADKERTSRDRDKPIKTSKSAKQESSESNAKKETESKAKTSNPSKEKKKRKKDTESKPKSPDRKSKSAEKQNKSNSCLPNVSQVRRRKKKVDLEKHKRAHRSAPDLSSDDMSRVGAWLNANSFYWPAEASPWYPTMAFPYGTLPKNHPHSPVDGAFNPRKIVDGMGTPVGTLYPDGTFVAEEKSESISSDGKSKLEQPHKGVTMPMSYGMPHFFQAPYPYFIQPNPPYDYFYNAMQQSQLNNGGKMMSRSFSHNHIDNVTNERTHTTRKSKNRIRNEKQKTKSRLSLPDDPDHVRESTSSYLSSPRPRTNEYYSDIPETKISLNPFMTYTANRQISVDNVKHAVISKVKTPEVSSDDSDLSIELSDSSFNDVELDDSSDVPKIKSSSSSAHENQPGKVRIFQPMSSREVFIDGGQDQPKAKTTRNIDSHHPVSRAASSKSPVMRLGERESIVATSFIVEGAKVFCLTKTTQTTPQLEKRNDSGKLSAIDSTLPKSTQETKDDEPRDKNSSKRNSGTWFQLTGSQAGVVPDAEPEDEKPNHSSYNLQSNSLSSSSSSSISSSSTKSSDSSPKVASTSSHLAVLPSSVNQMETKRLPSPIPKPRLSRVETTPIQLEGEENVFLDSPPRSSSQTSSDRKERSSPDVSGSSSSESEPLMRDEDHSIAKKLIRIDSRDSFTMKRRKYHRRSSSLTDKVVSRHDSFGREMASSSNPGNDEYGNDVSSSSADYSQPFVDALLHKAKSEEALKREMSRSSEALLSNMLPPPRKETLQERAARILGLNSRDLHRTKDEQAAQGSVSSDDSDAESDGRLLSEPSHSSSTGNKANLSSRSEHVSKTEIRPDQNKAPDSESFAVSVTESMLNRVQDQIEIKNLDVATASNSSDDASSISTDSASSSKSSDFTSIPDAEYLIEVSDSVLEDASVPCSVKPHKEAGHRSAPKEYKLPDDVLVRPTSSTTGAASLITPGSGQASIVASYADSIYERVPVAHISELSDDTTETESLDQFSRFREQFGDSPVLQRNKIVSPSITTESRTLKENPASRSSPYLNEARAVHSPVPIAQHSAPLTSDELDIVKELYNSVEENGLAENKTASTEKPVLAGKSTVDSKKEKVARAIGFNVANIGGGSKSNVGGQVKLEKVEDFDIKIFPNASNSPLPSSSGARAESDAESDAESSSSSSSGIAEIAMEEVMYSLGMKPEQSWVVEL